MRSHVEQLLIEYRTEGVLVDANLLLLYVVGVYDPSKIERFKHTNAYEPETTLSFWIDCSVNSRRWPQLLPSSPRSAISWGIFLKVHVVAIRSYSVTSFQSSRHIIPLRSSASTRIFASFA